MSKLGLLDRMLAAVAPGRALKRVRAKMALAQATMYFEGAAKTGRTRHWRSKGSDANAAAEGQRARLRNVSRDMVRNNPLATRAKTVVVNAIVGTGIIPSITAKRPQRKQQVDALIAAHCDTTAIDADGIHDLYGLQAISVGGMFESGECFLRRRYRLAADGWPLPFQIQVLEADYCDDRKTGRASNGNLIVQGVEFDLIGRRVAYWMFDQHPGALTPAGRLGFESRRVDAGDVIHLYRVDRPGQVRGIPWLAPVMVPLTDFAEFKDAQLVRQKIAACFAAFVHDPDFEGDQPRPVGSAEGEASRQFEEIGPGMVETLPPGKEISFSDPPSVGEFSSYADATARDIAVGVGITAEALTGNLSNVNFTSGRMGRLDMDANVEAWRWLTVIPRMCRRVEAWIADGVAASTMSREPFEMGWTPPRRPLIDPAREIPAMVKEVRAGFSSRRAKIRELGFDAEAVNAEIVADNVFADANGLVLDTDPRRVTQAGQGQQDAPPPTGETNA